MTARSARLTVALLSILLSTLASATCRDESGLQSAIASGYEPERLSLIACKAMPDMPDLTIVAFINEVGVHEFTMTVLVTAKTTRQVKNRFVVEDPPFGMDGDPTDVEIDTGRYLLAQNKRAFGVRVKHSLNSWNRTEHLNLFLPSDSGLQRVLKDLRVASSSMRGCPMESYEMKRIISLAQSTSHGLHDLLIRTVQIDYEPMINDGCPFQESTRTDTARLQYTGDSYAYPPGFY